MRRLSLLLPLLLTATQLFGGILALSGKRVSFYLEDRTGRFYMENPLPAQDEPKYLLFKDMPPTSFVTFFLNGRSYGIGDPALQLLEAYRGDGVSISALYQASGVFLRLQFLITNLGENQYESVAVVVSASNAAGTRVQAGARVLLDTVGGEEAMRPRFILASGETLDADRVMPAGQAGEYVYSGRLSADGKPLSNGLYIYPAVNELRPDYLVFTSWKRLEESPVITLADPSSRFRISPTAAGDGAVAVYYTNVTVNPGEKVQFGTLLSVSRITMQNLVPPVVNPSADRAGISMVTLTNTVVLTNAALSQPLSVTQASRDIVSTAFQPLTQAVTQLTAAAPQAVVTQYIGLSNDAAGMEDRRKAEELALLRAQAELFSKMSLLLEKIEPALSSNLAYPVRPESRPETRDTGVVTQFLPSSGGYSQPAAVVTNTSAVSPGSGKGWMNAPISGGRALQSYQPAVTNTPAVDPYLLEDMERESDRKEKEYRDRMSMLTNYYMNEIRRKEDEFKQLSSGYRRFVEERDRKADKDRRLKEMDEALALINERISIVEQLLELNLDFKSMPLSRIEELTRQVEELERRLGRN